MVHPGKWVCKKSRINDSVLFLWLGKPQQNVVANFTFFSKSIQDMNSYGATME